MRTVVIFGRDSSLLEGRKWLLEQQGYRVHTVEHVSELEDIVGPVQLLILCHTVGEEDGVRALAIASARWPGIRRLVLLALDGRHTSAPSVDEFSIQEGPRELISRVQQLVPPTQSQTL